MSCNIYIDKYIFSVEKVSRLGKKYTTHYVFIGEYDEEYENIFQKFPKNLAVYNLKLNI